MVVTDTAKILFANPEEPKTFITEWMALWPVQAKRIRTVQWPSPRECLLKLERFLKKHKCKRDELFTATQSYINRYARKNFEYMRTPSNFIFKGNVDTSDLLSEIEAIRSGGDVQQYIERERSL